MSIRNSLNTGGSNISPTSEQSQPMDLAQKSNRISEVASVLKGGTTLVQFGSTQLIATSAPTPLSKTGTKNENISCGMLISRQSSQGTLSMTLPNSTSTVNVSQRSITHSTTSVGSTASLPSTAYHIPRGAAVVANMTASRSQNLSSIIRTTSQVIGAANASNITTRASIISQRMVPMSNNTWIRNVTPATTSSAKQVASPVTGKATISPGRVPQTSLLAGSSAFQSGSSIRPGVVRPHLSPTIRVGASAEIIRPVTPKGLHITQPASHNQKLTGGTGVAKAGPPGFVSPGPASLYAPNSPLVTSLASSGTTITPHPANRIHPPTAVRLTPAANLSVTVTQSNATTLGGICLTPSSTGTMFTQHTASISRDQVKSPLLRGGHSVPKGTTTALPAGTHISFSGPKVLSHSSAAPPLALAQITNVVGQKTHGPVNQITNALGHKSHGPTNQAQGITPVPFQTRPGSTVGGHLGRGSAGPTISMTKVIPQGGKLGPANAVHALGPAGEGVSPHANLVVQRSNSAGSIPSSEKTMVTQYNLATPCYFEPGSQASLSASATLVQSPQFVQSVAGMRGTPGAPESPSAGGPHPGMAVPLLKPNSSPRPSILRKRTDADVVSSKATKNLSAALNVPMASPPSPTRPDSRGNGNVSSGSTTLSANSSPGMQINEEDSNNGKTPKSDLSCDDSSSSRPPSQGQPAHGNAGPAPCVINVPLVPRCAPAGTVASFIEAAVASSLAASADKHDQSLPPDGVSPRKKPRKQTLMGNELMESVSAEEMFERPVIKKVKREKDGPVFAKKAQARSSESDEDRENILREPPAPPLTGRPLPPDRLGLGLALSPSPPPEPVLKKPQMLLMNSFRQSWKSRHNHFARHSDVRPKEEKKRTVNEIANQKMAMQRVNGWKVVHLSGQVEDLVGVEADINRRLHSLLNGIEKRQPSRKPYKDFEKDVNRLSELFKANMQRSVIIKDQMKEAKTQMTNIFTHKDNIVNILSKYGNKRTLRKKEKISH